MKKEIKKEKKSGKTDKTSEKKKSVVKHDVKEVDKDEVAKKAGKVKKEAVADNKPDKKQKEAELWKLNSPVETKNLIATLACSSILIKLQCSAWRGTKTSKDLASDLANSLHGDATGFSVGLKFLPPDMRKELDRRISVMRKWIADNTLAFGDGWRLLPTQLWEPLKGKVEDARIQVEDYVRQMASKESYETIVEYAKRVLAKAYTDDLVPPPADLIASFKYSLAKGNVHIPTKLDAVSDSAMKELQEDMMEAYSKKYHMGIMELVEGLRETLESLVAQLEKNQEKGGQQYKRVLGIAEERIENIQRLDVFKSKRIRMALEKIDTEVLAPLRKNLTALRKDGGKRKEIVDAIKKVKKNDLDDLRV